MTCVVVALMPWRQLCCIELIYLFIYVQFNAMHGSGAEALASVLARASESLQNCTRGTKYLHGEYGNCVTGSLLSSATPTYKLINEAERLLILQVRSSKQQACFAMSY